MYFDEYLKSDFGDRGPWSNECNGEMIESFCELLCHAFNVYTPDLNTDHIYFTIHVKGLKRGHSVETHLSDFPLGSYL